MIIPTSVVFSISLYTDGQDLDQRMFFDYACKLQSSKSLTGMQYGMGTNHKPSEVSLKWSQFRIGPTSLVVPRHHANPTRCQPGIGFFLKLHTRPGVKISDPFHPWYIYIYMYSHVYTYSRILITSLLDKVLFPLKSSLWSGTVLFPI